MLKGTFSFREVRRERILDNRNKALKVQEKQAAMMEKVIAMMMVMMVIVKLMIKTSQELQMLSSVTINCQVTNIVMNSGSQLSALLSVSQMSQVPMIAPLGCSLMEVDRKVGR